MHGTIVKICGIKDNAENESFDGLNGDSIVKGTNRQVYICRTSRSASLEAEVAG